MNSREKLLHKRQKKPRDENRRGVARIQTHNAIATLKIVLARGLPALGNIPVLVKSLTNFRFPLLIAIYAVFSSINVAAEGAASAYQRGEFDVALKEFRYQAERGDHIAQNNLGVMYLKGRGVDINYAEARHWFEAAAESELPGAMFNLGIMNLRGYGQPVDAAAAARWFRHAAELGDREAQFFLALQYSRGNGLEQSEDMAKQWFEAAANGGLPAAQFNLAMMHLRLNHGDDSNGVAQTWLEAAAATGHENARFQLARLHLRAADDPDHAVKAASLMRQLADDGNIESQMQLGLMYLFGHGVESTPEEGLFWLRQAGLAGFGPAQVNLAAVYAQGISTDRDLVKAHAWLTLAKESQAEASAVLSDIEAEMSESELSRAGLLVTELLNLMADNP